MLYSFCERGTAPIAKNIIVTDENGAVYEATYPKRAGGLVKNGRARFIDENTICLARPPHQLEGKLMKTADIVNDTQPNPKEAETVREQQVQQETDESVKTARGTEPSGESAQLSMEFVLSRIDKIINDTAYLHEALDVLKDMAPSAAPGDVAGQARGDAIGNVVKAREETNRKLLEMLQKMYDDLRPKDLSGDVLKLQQLTDALSSLPPTFAADIVRRSAQQMFVKPGAEIVL